MVEVRPGVGGTLTVYWCAELRRAHRQRGVRPAIFRVIVTAIAQLVAVSRAQSYHTVIMSKKYLYSQNNEIKSHCH